MGPYTVVRTTVRKAALLGRHCPGLPWLRVSPSTSKATCPRPSLTHALVSPICERSAGKSYVLSCQWQTPQGGPAHSWGATQRAGMLVICSHTQEGRACSECNTTQPRENAYQSGQAQQCPHIIWERPHIPDSRCSGTAAQPLRQPRWQPRSQWVS